MPVGGSSGLVTYSQMVEYVARVTDPMETHMRQHDAWHVNRLTAEQQAARTNLTATIGIYIAIATVVVNIALSIWLRR